MFNEKKKNKLLFQDLVQKLSHNLNSIEKKISTVVFISHQPIILAIYKEKWDLMKSFIATCEDIKKIDSQNEILGQKIVEIAEEFIIFSVAFTTWYEKNIVKMTKSPIKETDILNKINLFFLKLELKLSDKIKILLEKKDSYSSDVMFNKLNDLLELIQDIQFDNSKTLKKHIFVLDKDIDENDTDLQDLKKLFLKTIMLTDAEAGTLYSLKNNELHFLLMFNQKITGTSDMLSQQFPPVQLYNLRTGKENLRYISVYTALKNQCMNISNIKDFKDKVSLTLEHVKQEDVGPDVYQQKTGYKGKTFLSIPIQSDQGPVIGVLQLSNKLDKQSNKVQSFNSVDEELTINMAVLVSKHIQNLIHKQRSLGHVGQDIVHDLFLKTKAFPFYKQIDEMDCGPSCLRMITSFYGKEYSLQFYRDKCMISNEGVTMLGLSDAAEDMGYRTDAYYIDFKGLLSGIDFPVIVNWGDDHFIIVYKVIKNRIWVADPAVGLLQFSSDEFKAEWNLKNSDKTIAMLTLEPTPYFYSQYEIDYIKESKPRFMINYFKRYKSLFLYLMILFFLIICFSVATPLLIQYGVDKGLESQDSSVVVMILGAQFMIFAGIIIMTAISNIVVFYLNSKLTFAMMSDFMAKLLQLKKMFFDVKTKGDLLQRIADHEKFKHILSFKSIESLLSSFLLIIFSILLLYYSFKIFLIYLACSLALMIWIRVLVKHRHKLNSTLFEYQSSLQSMYLEIVDGIEDIKINAIEKEVRWSWKLLKRKHDDVQNKWIKLKTIQKSGHKIINQFKTVLITFSSIIFVIQGDMSFGVMMAIQFIVGQINILEAQVTNLFVIIQDNSIPLERLSSIYQEESERSSNVKNKIELQTHSLSLNNVCFSYDQASLNQAVSHMSCEIEEHKITAIMGESGSGKSTLIKLLLKFYEPTKGSISIGGHSYNNVSHAEIREQFGVVMQHGYIFSDTIEANICLTNEKIDQKQFSRAIKTAGVDTFLRHFEEGGDTKVGSNGYPLSKEQRQQICIARALYKNPAILILDEAASGVGSQLESQILAAIKKYYPNLTVLIVTNNPLILKQSNHIIVMSKGKIKEMGTHKNLSEKGDFYFKLLKNKI